MSIGGSSDDRLAKVSNGRSLLRVMLDAPRVSLVQCTCNGFVHVTCCNSLMCMQAPCPHRQQSIRPSSTLGKIQHLPSPCLPLCRRAGAPPPPPPHPNWKPGQPPPPPGLGLGSKTCRFYPAFSITFVILYACFTCQLRAQVPSDKRTVQG